MDKTSKILIMRFSAFGDIAHTLSLVSVIKERHSSAKIYFLTKKEFAPFVTLVDGVDKVWSLDSKDGLNGIKEVVQMINHTGFDLIYDAHNTPRTFLIKLFIKQGLVVTRPKNRIRRLAFFKLRWRVLPWPFIARISYVDPIFEEVAKLKSIKFNFSKDDIDYIYSIIPSGRKIIVLAPVAAWEMKCWPLEYYDKLIKSFSDDFYFIILGGPKDKHIKELEDKNQGQAKSFAGDLTLVQSCLMISKADFFIGNDTGLLHVADLMGKEGVGLFGPSAFGFTYSKNLLNLKAELSCMPCSKDGRGKCSQSIYKKCLIDLTPEKVFHEIKVNFVDLFSSPKANDL